MFMVVGWCWLESRLVAARWGGQESSYDHSSTLGVGDRMFRWSTEKQK